MTKVMSNTSRLTDECCMNRSLYARTAASLVGDAASKARDLNGVGETCSEEIRLPRRNYLHLALKATESCGINQAVTVVRKRRAMRFLFVKICPLRTFRQPRFSSLYGQALQSLYSV
jgi:hypothetical protein